MERGIQMSDSKTITIYSHHIDIARDKKGADNTPYSISAVCAALSSLFDAVVKKDLQTKTQRIEKNKKVIWLESVTGLQGGNFNLTFKSAKYDQSREVRNTDTMEARGRLQNPEDGAEEKTHLCIRLRKGAERFTAVLDGNFYGVSMSNIRDYLNWQFNSIQEDSDEQYSYSVSFEMMLGEDFLAELDKMDKINLMRITVDITELGKDFQSFAGRDEVRSTGELYIRKEKGKGKKIPKDMISTAYQQHTDVASKKRIKKIAVEGTNNNGSLKIDTESIHMKHSIEVSTVQPTNELDTADFFTKADAFIKEMGV